MKSTDIELFAKDGVSSFNNLSPELMTNLMHNLPGMAYRCRNDENWTMLFLSEGCLPLTGFSPQELLYNSENSYSDVIHPEDRALVVETVHKGVVEHSRFQMEYRIVNKSGECRWVWEQGNAVYDESGDALYLDGLITDISVLKASQERSEKLAIELEEANLKKDKFLDIIAHDLQNPIHAIISTADFLTHSKNNLNMEQVIDFCSQIHSSAHSVSVLLENLVEWSRVQTTKIEVKTQLLKLGQLIEEAIKLHDKHICDKGIVFEIDVPCELYMISNLRMLESILRNLISNAVKYSDHGQTVVIKGFYEGDTIVFQISDSGIGISRQQLRTLFDIGNDIRSMGTALETGSGLGLILVKKYVDQLAGKIKIDSKVNKGTKVTITLPGHKADPSLMQRVDL